MIQTLCIWLANTALSHLFAELGWFVPTVQTVHILGIAVVITLLFVLNFRLLRITRSGPPLQRIAQDSLPWVWRALLVLLTTGVLLTITEPARELLNSAFRWKMLMVVVLAVLTAVIQFALKRDPAYWSTSPLRRMQGNVIAVASLILCISIVAAGRLIAYV